MRGILRRFILGLLLLVTVFGLFLVGSVIVDIVIGGGRLQSVTNTMIPGRNGGPDVLAYVARPPGGGPFPAVIMIHEFYGLDESILSKADGLAEEGYLVVAPDTFRGSTTSWIPRAIFQVLTSRPEQVNADLDSVYAWAASQPDVFPNRVTILGFCYGGRVSLNYSLQNDRLAATVIFYGSPITDPEVLEALPGPVLGIFGGADISIPLEQVQAFENALNQAGIPNEITVYEGQPHAFVKDMESIRQNGPQADAWGQMLGFLEQNLKRDSGFRPVQVSRTYTAPLDWRYYLMLAYEHAFRVGRHSHD